MPCVPLPTVPDPQIPEPFSIGTPSASVVVDATLCCQWFDFPLALPPFALPLDPAAVAALNAAIDEGHDVVIAWIDSVIPPCPCE